MSTRTREKFSNYVTGYSINNATNVKITNNSPGRDDWVQDTVGEGNGRPFYSWKGIQEGGLINRVSGAANGESFYNYRCEQFSNVGGSFYSSIHTHAPGAPSNATLATQLVKATNPSRPVVDIPVFVAELRDFPRLLRIEGNTLIRKAGSANLSYHFGWRPLIGDLLSLLDFSDQVAKRERELKDLYKSGLRRKRRLWEGTYSFTRSGTYQSRGILVSGTHTCSSQTKLWGFVEWYPTTLPPETSAAMRSLARRAVLGLTVDLSTAWELIPFSWLVDWCSNVGDFLAAHRNIVGAAHGPVQIMRNTKTMGSWPGNSNVSRHTFSVETKQRFIATPSLNAYLPYLSLRQLSILASIGVTRRVPRSSL